MKAGHVHRIPLMDRALDILKGLPKLNHNPHVFPGHANCEPLFAMAKTMQFRRMDRSGITDHVVRLWWSMAASLVDTGISGKWTQATQNAPNQREGRERSSR